MLTIMKVFVALPLFLISLAVGVLADGPDGSSSVKSPRQELTDLQGKLKSDSLHAMENYTKRNEIKERLKKMIKLIEDVSKDTGSSLGDAMKQVTDMERDFSKNVKRTLVKMRPVYHDSNTLILEINRVLAGTDEDAVTAKVQEAKELLARNKPVLEELKRDYRGKYAQFEALETALRKKGLVLFGTRSDPYDTSEDVVGESGYSGSDIRSMFLGKTPIPALTKDQLIALVQTTEEFLNAKILLAKTLSAGANKNFKMVNESAVNFAKLVKKVNKLESGRERERIKEVLADVQKLEDEILNLRILIKNKVESAITGPEISTTNVLRAKGLLKGDGSGEAINLSQSVYDEVIDILKIAFKTIEKADEILKELEEETHKVATLTTLFEDKLDKANSLYMNFTRYGMLTDAEMKRDEDGMSMYGSKGLVLVTILTLMSIMVY
ncbi:signal peptide containing protein [Theileria equi strain WA]|uniref:Signal peptide containing protein n=1 Tax=Theileria equi strain WA TaxID=1537102 RepID=L1LDS4_THEEQ|nr:signal peptide containing protein [Theileria equi strain WA]EKX73506.1 signal peptide containing protein [Theileria equi strain WA]|eukprot:XP_004832958.1 signal peptide containing protein [Theileria equi strain WA]